MMQSSTIANCRTERFTVLEGILEKVCVLHTTFLKAPPFKII